MKKYVTLLLIVLTGALQGIKAQTKIDQIFKVDRSAFKCKVDEISETDVYFMMLDDPTKKRQMLPKKTLWKIVFFDGAEELINEPVEIKPAKDLIYKKDKSIIECKIIRITEKIIEYRMNASEASPMRELERKLVTKITYADGTTESMDGKKPSKKDAKSSSKSAKKSDKSAKDDKAPDAPVKIEEEVETKKKGLFKWRKKVQEPKKPKVKEPEL